MKGSFKYSLILCCVYIFGSIVLSRNPELYVIHTYLKYILLGVYFAELLLHKNIKPLFPYEFVPIVLFVILTSCDLTYIDFGAEHSPLYPFIQSVIFALVIANVIARNGQIWILEVAFMIGIAASILIPELTGTKDQITSDGERFTGMVENANEYASMIILSILIAYRKIIYSKSTFQQALLVLFLILCSREIIIYCGSRNGLILLIGFYFFMAYRIILRIPLVYKIIVAVLFIISLQVIFLVIKNSPYFDRYNALFGYFTGDQTINVDESILTRAEVNKEAIDLWKEKPFLGWGLGQFIHLNKFKIYAHNNFLELLVNQGLIGLLIYYSFFIILFKKIANLKKAYSDYFYWVVVFIIIFLIGELSSVTYYSTITWIVLGMVSGNVNYLISEYRKLVIV